MTIFPVLAVFRSPYLHTCDYWVRVSHTPFASRQKKETDYLNPNFYICLVLRYGHTASTTCTQGGPGPCGGGLSFVANKVRNSGVPTGQQGISNISQ